MPIDGRLVERLYRQAHFDPLTQLPNRALFRDRLAQELAAAATGLTRGALMYVDLDHFKRVGELGQRHAPSLGTCLAIETLDEPSVNRH